MILRALIARGTSALDQGDISNATRDARLLAAHVCDIDPSRVTLHEMDEVSEAVIARFDDAWSISLCRDASTPNMWLKTARARCR